MRDWDTHHCFPPAHQGRHKAAHEKPHSGKKKKKSGASDCQGKEEVKVQLAQWADRDHYREDWDHWGCWFQHYILKLHPGAMKHGKKAHITHPIHLLVVTYFVAMWVCHQEVLFTDTSEKWHHSDIHPSVLSLQRWDRGRWHLIQQTACVKERSSWPSLQTQMSVYRNSTSDPRGGWKALRCPSSSRNYSWWTWKFRSMKQAGFCSLINSMPSQNGTVRYDLGFGSFRSWKALCIVNTQH